MIVFSEIRRGIPTSSNQVLDTVKLNLDQWVTSV